MIRAEAHASTSPRPENTGASGLRAHRSPNRRRTCADASAAARVHTDELADTDIAAVITFTKNNWSNKTGQLVQPAEVKVARK